MDKKKNKELKVEFHPGFFKDVERLFSNNLRFLIPRKLSDWKYEIIWAWQRVFRGYDDRLVWDFHWYVSKYFPIIIRKLKSMAHGFPSNPFEEKKNKTNTMKHWKATLEKIAKGFDAAKKLDEHEYMKEIKLKKPRKDIFGKDSYVGFKTDKRHYNKQYKEFVDGIELFKKHFFNLWD